MFVQVQLDEMVFPPSPPSPTPPLNLPLSLSSSSRVARVNLIGGHLSCNFYSYYSTISKQYSPTEASLQSHFEKLNFEAIRTLIQTENIECEFKYDQNGGGWDIFLTTEEFEEAKREIEGMKSADGYVSTLKIFEGEIAAKVSTFCL